MSDQASCTDQASVPIRRSAPIMAIAPIRRSAPTGEPRSADPHPGVLADEEGARA